MRISACRGNVMYLVSTVDSGTAVQQDYACESAEHLGFIVTELASTESHLDAQVHRLVPRVELDDEDCFPMDDKGNFL